MIPHQRRQAAQTNPFSFTNNKQDVISDEVAFGRWAERIKSGYSGGRFSRSTDPRVGPWTARSSPRRYDEKDDDDDNGVPSPTLWERKSYSSYLEYEEEEIEGGERFRLSSRAQAIAGYRQEMMDLVKDVPENAYELSLRDIVESPRIIRPTMEEKITEDKIKKGRKKRAKKVSRSDSLDAGVFLLKMFVPQTLGRRQSFIRTGSDIGVPTRSPKPAAGDGGIERDWWKRNELSESSGSSSRGSRSSSTRRKMSGCFPIFSNNNKSKALEFEHHE